MNFVYIQRLKFLYLEKALRTWNLIVIFMDIWQK